MPPPRPSLDGPDRGPGGGGGVGVGGGEVDDGLLADEGHHAGGQQQAGPHDPERRRGPGQVGLGGSEPVGDGEGEADQGHPTDQVEHGVPRVEGGLVVDEEGQLLGRGPVAEALRQQVGAEHDEADHVGGRLHEGSGAARPLEGGGAEPVAASAGPGGAVGVVWVVRSCVVVVMGASSPSGRSGTSGGWPDLPRPMGRSADRPIG